MRIDHVMVGHKRVKADIVHIRDIELRLPLLPQEAHVNLMVVVQDARVKVLARGTQVAQRMRKRRNLVGRGSRVHHNAVHFSHYSCGIGGRYTGVSDYAKHKQEQREKLVEEHRWEEGRWGAVYYTAL
jgi:hypothetical protein